MTNLPTYIPTFIHTCTQHVHMHLYIHIDTYLDTYTNTYLHACTASYIPAYPARYVHTYTFDPPTLPHTPTTGGGEMNTYMHTYLQTSRQMYIHFCPPPPPPTPEQRREVVGETGTYIHIIFDKRQVYLNMMFVHRCILLPLKNHFLVM